MAGGRRIQTMIGAGAAAVALVAVGVVVGVAASDSDDETNDPPTPTVAAAEPAPTSTVASASDDSAESAERATPTAPTVPAEPGAFLETFTGAPDTPTPWSSAAWDLTIHSRDVAALDTLDVMQASHGPDCSPPDDTHETSQYEAAVYQCRDHVMTAINGPGYAMLYLTPDRMLDFSEEAVIRFDISTKRLSSRDWWDVWISPYDEHLQLPLELGSDVDVTGPPERTVHVLLGNNENNVRAEIRDGFDPVQFPDWPYELVTGDVYTGYETFLEPDSARRDTIEIRLSPTHLKVGMPDYDFWWIDTEIPELDWTQGVVQFGHHSYNPTKDCHTDNNPVPPVDECLPNTWHWDNIEMDPTVPFTIVQTDRRQADATAPTLELASPAPADAHLRFAGIGNALEVSFDGGPWESAELQKTARETKEEHFASYWHPIPEGTETVTFRGEDWWADIWRVRDVTVWSPAAP